MENSSPLTTERIFYAYLQVARCAESQKDISLAKIAEKLGVSRQAIFKNHFQNIPELTQSLHYYVDNKPYQLIKSFVDQQEGFRFHELMDFFAKTVIPALYEKHEFLGIFYSEVSDPSWAPYLNQRYVKILASYFDNAAGNQHGLSSTTLSTLLISQVMATLSIWLTKENPETPDVFAERFIYLFSHSMLDLSANK